MLDVLMRLGIALFIGALVGIDRERKQAAETVSEIGGIRTFTLFALAGAVSAWIASAVGQPVIFAAATLGIVALIVVGYRMHVAVEPESVGLTTEVAALVVFLLGGATLFGFPEVSVAVAVAVSFVLAYKQPIHEGVAKLGKDDVAAGLKLLFASCIVLPVLPNRTVDPWDAVNPYETWWLVVLISALSLVGYVASRWLGAHHGLAITGLAGGLVSSTAVTLSFARRSREGEEGLKLADVLAASMLVAWCVMFVRVSVEVAVVHAPLLRELILPMAAMALVALAAAVTLLLRGRRAARTAEGGSVPLKNPFSLVSAMSFGALFTVVLLVVKIVQEHAPASGVKVVAALAGLTDVDAITLSMARLARESGDTETAVAAIVIAVLSNTCVKAGMAAVLGTRALAGRVLGATALVLVAGAVAVLAF